MISPTNQEPASFLETAGDDHIAYRHIRGEGPTILWLGGFLSDMVGS